MISKFSSLIYRMRTSDRIYFEEQFMYGHREALLHYSKKFNNNLGDDFILEGSIDHGWVYGENLWLLRKKNLRRATRYVWNERQANILSPIAKVIPAGSPWLYMLSDLGVTPNNISRLEKKTNKIVIFPGHNTNTIHKLDLIKSMDEYKLRVPVESEVTVCLFWTDFCDPNIRQAYERLGWKVESAGFVSRLPHPDSIQGNRPNFLLNLFEIIKDAEMILTDEISTGMFYSLTLGAKVCYFPTNEAIKYEKAASNINAGVLEGAYTTPRSWAENYFPDIDSTGESPKKFVDFSWKELGYESFRSNSDSLKFKWIKSDTNTIAIENYSKKLLEIKKSLKI